MSVMLHSDVVRDPRAREQHRMADVRHMYAPTGLNRRPQPVAAVRYPDTMRDTMRDTRPLSGLSGIVIANPPIQGGFTDSVVGSNGRNVGLQTRQKNTSASITHVIKLLKITPCSKR